MSALGINTNDLVGPVNQRLQRDGKPPITARQLEATVRAVAQRGLHDGRVGRQVLVDGEVAEDAVTTGQLHHAEVLGSLLG